MTLTRSRHLLTGWHGQRILWFDDSPPVPKTVVDDVDQVGQRDGQYQVEHPGRDQRREAAGLRVEVAADLEQFALAGDQPEEVHQRGPLQQRDELVDERR